MKHQTLIIGASSTIAQSIATQLLRASDTGLILVSRDFNKTFLSLNEHVNRNIIYLKVENYLPQTIKNTVSKIYTYNQATINQVFICNGLLHGGNIYPEKRIEEFDPSVFLEIMTVNAVTPLLWIQSLAPMLAGNSESKIVVFSARVGSINDNYLGGWYSYRASKSALNMLLKTASIELARTANNIKVILFHPGTTNTPLSKPFQKNVPQDKLFTSEFVAKRLLDLVDETQVDGEISFLDWQGQPIKW